MSAALANSPAGTFALDLRRDRTEEPPAEGSGSAALKSTSSFASQRLQNVTGKRPLYTCHLRMFACCCFHGGCDTDATWSVCWVVELIQGFMLELHLRTATWTHSALGRLERWMQEPLVTVLISSHLEINLEAFFSTWSHAELPQLEDGQLWTHWGPSVNPQRTLLSCWEEEERCWSPPAPESTERQRVMQPTESKVGWSLFAEVVTN